MPRNHRLLTTDFFARPAPDVAPDLLGKCLIRRTVDKEIVAIITEAEAYEGIEDLACHASKGRTRRTDVMFGPPGRFYVYLIYGMHQMLNVVTNSAESPSAVLIRPVHLVSGPGRLTRALGIDTALNGLPAMPESGLWFEDHGITVSSTDIELSRRIGVDYAGPIWSAMPWRFTLAPDFIAELDQADPLVPDQW